MDSNNFKKSQDYSNLESNKAHNPAYKSGIHAQHVSDYIEEMKGRNQEATQEGFMNKAKNDSPPEAWNDQEKAYNDAWENNKNSPQDEDE